MTSERLKWIISGIDWDRLTDREEKFVESAEAFFKQRNYLTEAQEKWLEDIYANKSK